jgi:preprotein translocase subunit SecA
MFWMEHLDEMEHLRDSVRLRAMGQKDPLVEYKNEGHKLFQRLLSIIKNNYVGLLYKAQIRPAGEEQRQPVKMKSNPGNKNIGRNDPCPCGAKKEDGTPKKYKNCCGKNA